jgi:hypothetical protein
MVPKEYKEHYNLILYYDLPFTLTLVYFLMILGLENLKELEIVLIAYSLEKIYQ